MLGLGMVCSSPTKRGLKDALEEKERKRHQGTSKF